MGLNASHGCFYGSHRLFNRWRTALAVAAELPPLELMDGHYGSLVNGDALEVPTFGSVYPEDRCYRRLARLDAHLPIRWECLKPDVLYDLLHHSDCEGSLPATLCAPLADRLEELLPALPADSAYCAHQTLTRAFLSGLRLAASQNEDVTFR